ncbi:unnamed protein product [Medioppia subpectinata]|uniref:Choline/ethanolamine kinase n=1 Tax=Medioppia subpectinata TaxID=1979941 RepID=A0A7R9KAV9_9ACAR|nr:unnamed protein product [Medioppia subpectinata]CAG2100036.1 unnamed protein product [Medioppia subpectinata]
MNQIDLIRGETPVDIADRCLQLCKEYLSDVWTQQTVDTIEVRRISGGMTNQLYYCGIKSADGVSTTVPREVAVRLYGPKYFNNDGLADERLTDIIIGLMVSRNGLGPRVYGMFTGGQIQAYYKHRQFTKAEQNNPQLVRQVFEGLARVHAMDVPTKREHWFFRNADKWYIRAQNNAETQTLIKELNLETLKTHSLKAEMDFLKQVVDKCESPMVFCHNDFRSSNIMVLEDNDCNAIIDKNILFCDYEYSSYGYRGHDFGTLVNEWGRSMEDFKKPRIYPDNSTLLPLIEMYVKESQRVLGNKFSDNKLNSVEHILKEMKIFALVISMFGVLFCLKQDSRDRDALDMDKKLAMVVKAKKTLKELKSLDELDIDHVDFTRGDTPVDIADRCLQLCKQYLSGVWTQQTVDTIEVKRITAGMTNQLYYCGIKRGADEVSTPVPREVAVRLYGQKYYNNGDTENERLTDIVVGLMVSRNGLGPRVYGMFTGGQILAYYKHRQFELDDQNNPQLVRQMIEGLARVHAMDVPTKRKHWFSTIAYDWYQKLQNNSKTQTLIKEVNCEALKTHDLKAEIEFVSEWADRSGSPLVFCHNDFKRANIMVLKDKDCNDNIDEKVLFCDYEYSSYGYRGHDFGTLVNEWGRSLQDMRKPYVYHKDSTLIPLIEIYVKESQRLLGKRFTDNKVNSVQHILKEVKIFSLILFGLKNDPDSSNSIQIDMKIIVTILTRGETPETIKDKCLELCKEYLSDNWRQQTVDTISVRRITGGLTNQLYYCGITSPSIESTVAQEVCERLSDVITALMVSENNLGPKIYGLFDGGQIQHFYHVRKFTVEEQNNPKLVEELFRKLAQIHAMEAPLPKREWILKEIDLHYKEAFKRFPINELIDKYNCKTLKENNLKVEIQWLKEIIPKTNSPIVFSHNDLWSNNIMLLNKETDSGDHLVFCDFEFSSYGNRGYDFGSLLGEWGRDVFEIFNDQTFIADPIVKQLLHYYISENETIFGESWSQNENNSMDQLIKEVKNLADEQFKNYYLLKKQFNKSSEIYCNQLYLKFDELVRGETPEDIQEKCLQLCKEYLSDNWRQQTVDTISVRRITGGLSNQLYYCGITSPSIESTAPQEVAIRLYVNDVYKTVDNNGCEVIKEIKNERLNDVIASFIMSTNNLGPKIYGLFDGGQIQQYYHIQKFTVEEQNNPKLVEELFRKMARIHAIEAPLPKSEWLLNKIDVHYKEASESPIVFSHNDLWSPNIMLLNKETDSGDQLVICDFEWTAYGSRGIDFGCLFGEWGRDLSEIHNDQTFVADSVVKQLLQHYIRENEIIFGKSWSQNENNLMDQLLRETKNDETIDRLPMDKQQFMNLAESLFRNYYRLKNQFTYKTYKVIGETPEGIKERCLELCKEYLSDNWRQQTVDTISVRRITGGLSNQLYYCGITSPSIESTAPQEVAIRLYGKKVYNNLESNGCERITDIRIERSIDVITSLMVSEHNLGPKIYGLFDGGQIQHFYHVHKFTIQEQNNAKLVEELFRKMARIHAMEAPLPKKDWILNEINLLYKEASDRFSFEELFHKYNCETFKANDLSVEIQWLKESIHKVKSPIVFSHNDLWSPNIMVLNKETDSGDQMVICDYESSSYGYRGIDLGSLLGEWGRPLSAIFADQEVVADSIIYGESWSQNSNNSMDQLLRETKVFSLANKMLILLICLKHDETIDSLPMNKQQYMLKVYSGIIIV